MKDHLTTIAALPGTGSGHASALRAEKVTKGREEKPVTRPDVKKPLVVLRDVMITNHFMPRITTERQAKRIADQLMAAKIKDPAPREKWSTPCPVKFEDPKEAGPTPADMAAHPVWGGKRDADFLDITPSEEGQRVARQLAAMRRNA